MKAQNLTDKEREKYFISLYVKRGAAEEKIPDAERRASLEPGTGHRILQRRKVQEEIKARLEPVRLEQMRRQLLPASPVAVLLSTVVFETRPLIPYSLTGQEPSISSVLSKQALRSGLPFGFDSRTVRCDVHSRSCCCYFRQLRYRPECYIVRVWESRAWPIIGKQVAIWMTNLPDTSVSQA